MKPIGEQIIVITGASSGIGRLTARKAAKAGAKVVLAARNREALEQVRREIEHDGGTALAVPTDVADVRQVDALGDRAFGRFGRVDTWVNDAAVSLYGEFLDVAPEEFRRVIEVNLLGTVYGTRTALKIMRGQPEGGSIVQISSGLGERGVPLQSAYAAAKFGVIGFSESVRVELEHAGLPINLAVLKPASIDTPFFHHARSKMGVAPKPIPPVYDPEIVADAILYAATHPVREMPVGGASAGMSLFEKATPRAMDTALAATGYESQQMGRPKAPGGGDNLFQGSKGPGSVRGGFGGRRFSLYTWLRMHPNVKRVAAATAAVAGVAALENWRGSNGDGNRPSEAA